MQTKEPTMAFGPDREVLTALEALAAEWHRTSDHAADGTPFGGPLCNCERVVQKMADLGWVCTPEFVVGDRVEATHVLLKVGLRGARVRQPILQPRISGVITGIRTSPLHPTMYVVAHGPQKKTVLVSPDHLDLVGSPNS